MKILIKSSCLLCLVLCGFFGNAQQQWKAAKVVTNNSDTIQGQINFEDWDQSPTSIQFKDEQGNVISKSVQEIKSFSIQEPLKTYESKSVTLSYYKKTIVGEGKSPIVKTDSATLFLEVLLQSTRVTLYECMDDESQARFFLRKDDKLYELRNPVYRVARGESSHLIKTKVYKSQLKQLLSECPTLETDHVSYTDIDIIKLLEKYLRYCNADFKTEFKQEALGQRLAFGGMYRHAPNYSDAQNYFALNLVLFSKKKFNSGFVSIELGLGFDKPDEDPNTLDGTAPYFGLYGGKYFGVGDWHPLIYTGLSNVNGPFDTGVGISYKRAICASVSAGLFGLAKDEPAWSFQLKITPFSKKN
jgi:hypothetical protein